MFRYDEPLFRPPSEAYSMIFQVTKGCSWNRCAFCEMYTSKKFSVKLQEEIEKEIAEATKFYPETRKVFLADGNAMVLSYNRLAHILDLLDEHFPRLTRVSAYALPSDILAKTDEELESLKAKGLQLLYVGIESGDDELLRLINKSETADSIIESLKKARKAGLKLSVMIINGLGGKEYSEQHARNSAHVVNEVQPEFLSTLVLSYPFGIEHYRKRLGVSFTPLDLQGLLKEMQVFIKDLSLEHSIFRSDHASNYLVIKGVLSRDKEKLLKEIQDALEHPSATAFRPEWMRGL